MIKRVVYLSLVLFSWQVSAQYKELKTKPYWQNLDYKKDGIRGISTDLAYQYLAKKQSKTVTVAIIDSGVEIDHPDLKGQIWVNPKEIAGNGIDDDKNGYIDDINGWDFLGNKNGNDITFENLEIVRELKRYEALIADIDPLNATEKEKEMLATFKNLKEKVDKEERNIEQQGGSYFLQIYQNFQTSKKILTDTFGEVEINDELLDKITEASSAELQDAKKFMKILKEINLNESDLMEAYHHFNARINYNLNKDYEPRKVIGDNVLDFNDKNYGNAEVEGPDAEHGTHVAGIIGGLRNNGIGANGISDNVKLMILRTVPDGDERDKDVALAIRYAVDNGAKVVNMSFGKAISPDKKVVDDAVRYAEKNNVLLIHAAGNDGLNLEKELNYPNQKYEDGGFCKTWIEVGASSWKDGADIPATFSNYGKTMVDVFAPGVDIYSSIIDYKAKENSGTSMAAPVVSGLAALIYNYFPNLTATKVRQIILDSAIPIKNQKVNVPESGELANFDTLSVTGGIVNALEAIKLAEKVK